MSGTTWKSSVLADLLDDTIGGLWGSPPDSKKAGEIDVLVVRGADFRNWSDRRAQDAAPRRVPARSLERRRLEPGDIVLEVSGGSPAQPVGRVLVIDERAVAESPRPLICSNFCRKLRLRPDVDPFFVKRQLDWLYRSGHTDRFQTSTTNIRNLQVDDFVRGTEVALPEQGLQGRLTALLDSIEHKSASGSTHVAGARQAVERFRQAILAVACSGRLTAQWRVEKGIADDPTDDVPAGWTEETLDDLGEWRTGGTPSRQHPEYFGGDVPWVKSADLRDGPVKATEEKLTPEALKNSSAKLMPVGTVSVALYGATIGRLGVFEIEAATNQACANCVPNSSVVDRWFLFYYLLGQRRGLVAAGQGGAQPNLTNRIVRDWPIALPPIEEQHEIVRRVDQFLALADVLRQRVEVASTQIDRSSQAVLAKAFRGELMLAGVDS